MALLEFLGIPRLRVWSLSIFNFLGTFLLAALLVLFGPACLQQHFTPFTLGCLAIPLAVSAHSVYGEETPLVKLCRQSWRCKLALFFLLLLGLPRRSNLLLWYLKSM